MSERISPEAQAIADRFDGLTPERKTQILEHITDLPDANSRQRAITQIVKNGGPEAELVTLVYQKEATMNDGKNAPDNKRLSAVQQKVHGTDPARAKPATVKTEPEDKEAHPKKGGK